MAILSLIYILGVFLVKNVFALQHAKNPIPQYFNIQSYGSGYGLDPGSLMGQDIDGSYVGFNLENSQPLTFHIDAATNNLYSGTRVVYASTSHSPPVLELYAPSAVSAVKSVNPLTCSIDTNLHLSCAAKIPKTARVHNFQIVQVGQDASFQLALGTGTSGSAVRSVNLKVVAAAAHPSSIPAPTSSTSSVNQASSTAIVSTSVYTVATKSILYSKIVPIPVESSVTSTTSSQSSSNTPSSITSTSTSTSTTTLASSSTTDVPAASSASANEFNIIGLVYGDNSAYIQSGSLIVGAGTSGSYIGTSINGWNDNVLSFSIDPSTNILSSGGYYVYASNITTPPILRLIHPEEANKDNVTDWLLSCTVAYNVTLYCQANQDFLVTPLIIDADHSGQRNLAIGGMNTGSYIDQLDLYVRPVVQQSTIRSANFNLQCNHNSNAPLNGLNLRITSDSPASLGFYVDGPELSLYLNYTDGFLYTSDGSSVLYMDVTTSPQQIRSYSVAGQIPSYVYPLICNIGMTNYLSCVTQESERSVWWDLNNAEHNIALGPIGVSHAASLDILAVFT